MMLTDRQQKGLEIAKTSRIMKQKNGGYVVPSQSGRGCYVVKCGDHESECDCPDFEKRHAKCKHIFAVEYAVKKELNADGSATVTKTMKVTYGQDWHAYNQAQTGEKALFQKLLYDLCGDIPNQTYKFGRPTLPLSDMIFALVLKVYTTFSLRRFITDMKEAKENSYVDSVCSYSSVSNYMRSEELTPLLVQLIQKSALPLRSVENDFSLDSSGFSSSRFDRWYSFKYGREISSKVWIKAHLMNGNKTHIVTSIKITEAYSHDTKEFQELVKETSKTFCIKEVSADKAYSSRDNLDLVNGLGAVPYIPFRSNVSGRRGSLIWGKMWHFFMFQRDEFLAHYHKRSNSETVFHMVKSKFGDAVRSKEWTAQVNEVLLKVLCHNICVVIQQMFELGIEPIFCLKSGVSK